MTDAMDVVARARARARRRALPVRERFALSPDPSSAWGIVPIKVAAEEQIQAVAFGPITEEPRIVTRLNPLSRDTADLEAFAVDLGAWADGLLASVEMPRLWVPTTADVDLLEMVGHRYRTNQEATDTLRRMGAICHALAVEARKPGQQAVAVARARLAEHVATGQSPILDGHLGAMLAWVDPPPGGDPASEAESRALEPAATMLIREDDDRVENLRRDAKRGGARGRRAEQEIHAILRAAAVTVWRRLEAARSAFWALALAPGDLGDLCDGTRDRLVGDYGQLRLPRNPPNRPKTLGNQLDDEELLVDVVEEGELEDFAKRERARRSGAVFEAEVIALDVPDARRNGFRVSLSTPQQILRARAGSSLRLMNGRVRGRVADVVEQAGGGYRIELVDCQGVRSRNLVAPGTVADWTDVEARDLTFIRRRSRDAMDQRQPPLVYADALPSPTARQIAGDLLGRARGLRR